MEMIQNIEISINKHRNSIKTLKNPKWRNYGLIKLINSTN